MVEMSHSYASPVLFYVLCVLGNVSEEARGNYGLDSTSKVFEGHEGATGFSEDDNSASILALFLAMGPVKYKHSFRKHNLLLFRSVRLKISQHTHFASCMTADFVLRSSTPKYRYYGNCKSPRKTRS